MTRLILFIFSAGLLFIPLQAEAVSPLLQEARENFEPLPDKAQFKKGNDGNEAKLTLGKALFFDTRLSRSNVFSCASCHNLATGGVDNNAFSTGHGWQVGGRNAPTVLNASLHVAQFWDGRAADVEAQAQGPILAGVEMAATKELALARIGSIPAYRAMFKKAFPKSKKPLTYENIANAIGAFERTLLTPSPFDAYLKGDEAALTGAEKAGLKLFMESGCSSCHEGVAVGGGLYRKFGVMNERPNLTDKGRIAITGDEADLHVFKVPSLRNIELTYPYFHDGSVWKLTEAIKVMGDVQLDLTLGDAEAKSIATFLRSLTGKAPVVTIPILPPSTDETPKPDRS